MSTSYLGFIGLAKADAITKAQEEDFAWRVIKQEGRSLPVSMDHNPDRINFVIENGIVTKVTEG